MTCDATKNELCILLQWLSGPQVSQQQTMTHASNHFVITSAISGSIVSILAAFLPNWGCSGERCLPPVKATVTGSSDHRSVCHKQPGAVFACQLGPNWSILCDIVIMMISGDRCTVRPGMRHVTSLK